METENDSPDELEIVYPTLSRELAPSRACATDDTVPLRQSSGTVLLNKKVIILYCSAVLERLGSALLSLKSPGTTLTEVTFLWHAEEFQNVQEYV